MLFRSGTRFIGRAFVELALENGHECTLFNRGKSNPFLFPAQSKVFGDRGRDLCLLENQRFDAVVDFCGYDPEEVRLSARELGSSIGTYVYISTISVYDDFSSCKLDESSPMQKYPKDPILRSYGNRKAECERVLEQEMPGTKLLIIRPTIVVGEFDPTNRFEKWLRYLHDEMEFSIPSEPDQPIQWIDVHDLNRFTLAAMVQGLEGVYNLCGPLVPMTLGEFAGCLTDILMRRPFFYFDRDSQNEFPFCTSPNYGGIFRVDASLARSQGLNMTTLEQTTRRIVHWMDLENQ